MANWTVEQWAAFKAYVQLALVVLIVLVWLVLIIQRGIDFDLESLMRLITLIYFGGTGAGNVGKLAAHRNGG